MVRAHVIQTAFKGDDLRKVDLSEVLHVVQQNDIEVDTAITEIIKLMAACTLNFSDLKVEDILHEVFDLSNNPSRDEEREAVWKGYSLSTGDLVIINDEVWFCDSIGWAKINPEAAARIINAEMEGTFSSSMGLRWLIKGGIVSKSDILHATCKLLGVD